MDFLKTLLFLFFFTAPVGTIIHETGHMAGALLVNADKVTFTIGTGKTVKLFHCKKVILHLGLMIFLGGFAASERSQPYNKWEVMIVSLSGPLINLLAFLIIFSFSVVNNDHLHIFGLFNLWLAFINIIPFKIRDKQSDGFIVLKAFQKKDTHLNK